MNGFCISLIATTVPLRLPICVKICLSLLAVLCDVREVFLEDVARELYKSLGKNTIQLSISLSYHLELSAMEVIVLSSFLISAP